MKGALLFSPVFLLLLLIPGYVSDTLMYHLAKSVIPEVKVSVFSSFFANHFVPILIFFLSLIPTFMYKYYRKPIIQISLLNLVFNAAYFLISSNFAMHYFVFFVPFACIIIGYPFIDFYERGNRVASVIGIFCVLILFVGSVSSLRSFINPGYITLENIVYGESGISDNLIDFSAGSIPAYLAFVTGRDLAPEYIDSSSQRVGRHVNMTDFLEEVKESRFVMWNLMWNPYYLNEEYPEVASYIRDNFYPRFVFFNAGDIFILWKNGTNSPLDTNPIFEGKYNTKYLKAYVNNTVYYGYIHPELNPGPVYSRYECIPCLVNVTGDTSIDYGSRIVDIGNNQTLAYIKLESEANYGGLRLLARNHTLLKTGSSSWSTKDGSLVSDSWITSHTENYTEVITLTRDSESVRSILFIQYSNPRRKYVYLVVYQLIGNMFIEVYKERID
jgi:hypothetical protein